MKTLLPILLFGVIFLMGCDEKQTVVLDTTPPVMTFTGAQIDTAYHNTYYNDLGVAILDEVNGQLACTNIHAEITGSVNTNLLGTYFLDYDAQDAAGNNAATLTRTVHVVENTVAFLNGVYNVAFTCTAVIGSSNPIVTSDNYIAAVTSGSQNYYFELNKLKIGSMDVIPTARLNDTLLQVFYFCCDSTLFSSSASGTLSVAKNSFTIESASVKSYPYASYHCINVYTNSNLKRD